MTDDMMTLQAPVETGPAAPVRKSRQSLQRPTFTPPRSPILFFR